MELPDIQTLKPEIPLSLNRVGVTGVKKVVKIKRGEIIVNLFSNFDVFVDLTSERKGVNLSRSFEVIDEVLEELTSKPVELIEDLNAKIADNLLEKHEYASKAEVKMSADLILRKKTPRTNIKTQEIVKIMCEVSKERLGSERIFIGVEVSGITACPCAQELIKTKIRSELKEIGLDKDKIDLILQKIPVASHNQRSKSTIKIQVTKNFSPRLEELIEIARKSMSCEVYEMLKREDELFVVDKIHRNPRFVEDGVRLMAKLLVEKFSNAPDDITVYLRQENEESIHQHNVVAERFASFGVLRKDLGLS